MCINFNLREYIACQVTLSTIPHKLHSLWIMFRTKIYRDKTKHVNFVQKSLDQQQQFLLFLLYNVWEIRKKQEKNNNRQCMNKKDN